MKPTLTLLTALLLAPLATPGADASLQREGKTDGMTALGTDFPKAVHYRYANNFKVKPGQEDAAYREWLANYGRMMGVELDGRVIHPLELRPAGEGVSVTLAMPRFAIRTIRFSGVVPAAPAAEACCAR